MGKYIQENRVEEKQRPNSIYYQTDWKTYSDYESFWALKTDFHLANANANASLRINLKQQLKFEYGEERERNTKLGFVKREKKRV